MEISSLTLATGMRSVRFLSDALALLWIDAAGSPPAGSVQTRPLPQKA